MSPTAKSIDREEVEQFTRIADEWWDAKGKFAPLHRINPLRIAYIRDEMEKRLVAIQGLRVLDIGCGGGLVCEPLARMGATVTGLDAGEKNIAVATRHAEQSGLQIEYLCSAAEDLAATGRQFDAVLALEIIEHVADVGAFLQAVSQLVRPGGMVIMSTISRTVKSYALAIIGAEYILRWLPAGTHDWNKFLKPSELARALREQGIEVEGMSGMVLNPFDGEWKLSRNLDVNYFAVGRKER